MAHVVTCFVRNRGQVLLIRRSDSAGTFPGHWAGISGYVEGDPANAEDDARRELREEIGLTEADLELVRVGESLSIEDDEGTFTVHPFLFESDVRALTTNEEIAATEWVDPTVIRDRTTVPRLWETWRRVAPTVETVREDRTHGSAWLSIRALEVLRDAAVAAADANDGWEAVAATGRDLRDARPEMAVIGNRVNRVLAEMESKSEPNAVVEGSISGIEAAVAADAACARTFVDQLPHDGSVSLATLSRSGTVRDALRTVDDHFSNFQLVVAESRPEREGVGVADWAATTTEATVTLTTEAALPTALDRYEVDAVLVGADSMPPSGDVINKTGTHVLALAADELGIPVYAVAAEDKICPAVESLTTAVLAELSSIESPAEGVYDGDCDVSVHAPTFERTPAPLVDGVATETGLLGEPEIRSVAESHAANATWDE